MFQTNGRNVLSQKWLVKLLLILRGTYGCNGRVKDLNEFETKVQLSLAYREGYVPLKPRDWRIRDWRDPVLMRKGGLGENRLSFWLLKFDEPILYVWRIPPAFGCFIFLRLSEISSVYGSRMVFASDFLYSHLLSIFFQTFSLLSNWKFWRI